MNKIPLILLSALLLWGTATSAQILSVEPLDSIVAVVDEEIVLRSELDRAVDNILGQYSGDRSQLPPRNVIERQVLERLVMQKLQVAYAGNTGLKISDAEVNQSLAQIAQSNNMQLPQLRAAIEQQGMSYEQFRDNLHDEIVVQRLQQRIAQTRIQVSDAEIDSLIDNNQLSGGQLHIQHILIALPDGASSDDIAAAGSKAESVRDEVAAGGDFAAAAVRHSDAQDALEGGDLGWRDIDQLPGAFVQLAADLQPGEVSTAIRGPTGFHIVKLIDRRSDSGPKIVTQYHARHIMIRITELTSDAAAQRSIENIRDQLAGGADFATLARQSSEDPSTANLGGDMGWFSLEDYGTRVGQIVSGLSENETSQPFKSEAGWHVLQYLGTRTQDRSEEMQRERAREALVARKTEQEYESFLRQMRSEAFVDVRLAD